MASVHASPQENKLFENVLLRLGFSSRPEPTLAGLCEVYSAWCRHVPFDNVRKLIHVHAGDTGPFPGATFEDFFEAWLRHGTGGTCWPSAGALYALLHWLGFDADRGVATMLVFPEIPPNHGTVHVRFGPDRFIVDTSMLHGEPLPLNPQAATNVAHPAWGVRCDVHEGRWMVTWRPLHKIDGFDCRLESFGAKAADFQELYEQTRGWSPFNYEVTARLNRGEEATGLAFGSAATLHADGTATHARITDAERRRFLVERLGMSEEIVAQLPPDVPTPPPPGSRTAMSQF